MIERAAETRKILKPLAYGCSCTILSVISLGLGGCLSSGQRAQLVQENRSLRREVNHMSRVVARYESTVSNLQRQVTQLQGFSPDRPVAMFAPVKVEIVSLSGGANYDHEPGDDGVTVYVRLRDADGDAVKAPGKITVQVVDNSRMGVPKVLGVYVFASPEQLRKTWFGKFGTEHYTLKCPFRPGTVVAMTKLDVRVEFVDYLTGKTLTAIKEVAISPAVKP